MFEFKFTIIITINNSQESIKKSIDSIISQSIGFKDDVEIIVVNVESSDKTKEIVEEYIEKYPNNITLINNEKLLTIASLKNLAIGEAKGEFISFLDSGDYISKKTLEYVFKSFNDNLNIDIINIPIYFYELQNKNHPLNYKFNELSDIHVDTHNNVVLSDNEYNLNIYDEDLDDVLSSPDSFNLHLFNDKRSGDFDTLSLDDEVILLDETYNLKLYEEDDTELVLAGSGVNTVNDVSIINLNEYPQVIQLSTCSTFFRAKSIGDIRFDDTIDLAYESVFINEILLKKPIIGLISNVEYYMKNNSISSYLDSSRNSKDYFSSRFKKFYFKLIENSIDYYGHVLEFVQYTIAYDLQYLFNIDSVDFILNNIEFKDIYFNLIDVLSYISDEIILNQQSINQSLKAHILFLKHFKYDYLSSKELKFKNSLFNDFDSLANSKMELSYQQMNLFKRLVKEDPICIDIYKIYNNEIYISGFYTSFFDLDFDIVLDIENTFESINCDNLEYPQRDYYALNCPYCYNHYFEVKVPLDEYDFDEEGIILSFRAIIDEESIIDDYDGFINENSFDLAIDFNKSCRLSRLSKYQLSNEYITEIDNNSIIVNKKSNSEILKLESKLLFKLFNKREKDWYGGISLRLLYSVFKTFKSKSIWIFMDKPGFTHDNAFNLYKYVDSINDKKIKKYYVLDKDSKDYNELKKVVNVLDNKSIKHKIITLFADKIISSNINKADIYPFWEDFESFAGLVRAKLIFLEDNITTGIISNKFYRANNDLDLFVCASDKEKDSFLDFNNHYNFTEDTVKVLGFPRFDNLIDKSKGLSNKEIVIIPSSSEEISNMEKDEFIQSEYFKRYDELLNNPGLIGFAKSKGYKLVFKPNNDIYKFIDEFNKHEAVEFDYGMKYEDILNNGSLIVTDYSPISFDFAYLKKPVIYYQFDKKSDIMKDSYFDYDKMGFGEVVDNQKELVDLIKDYIYMNCKMKNDYKLRVDDFFKFNDKNNCKRVYEVIKDL